MDRAWLARHVKLLRASYRHWTHRDLLPPNLDDQQAVDVLDDAAFAVLSHDIQADPIFNYANRAGLALFEMSWEDLLRTPSRLSAEPLVQEERDRLLLRVTQQGYIDDYVGVRISRLGKRFRIDNAVVWNLLDEQGAHYGQAALLSHWEPLEPR